jgi:hypothetical protein
MQSAPHKSLGPSCRYSLRKWIHEHSRFLSWGGCEGNETLVLEVPSRWFGFKFADKPVENEIRSKQANMCYPKDPIHGILALALSPWYPVTIALIAWRRERREHADGIRLAELVAIGPSRVDTRVPLLDLAPRN